MSYVPNYEEQYYEVHPSQLSWGMHSLAQQPGNRVMGYTPGAGGMMVIVVQVPVGTAQQDWRTAPAQRKRGYQWDVRRLVTIACVICIIAGTGYLGYSAMQGGAIPALGDIAKSVPTWDDIASALPQPAAPKPQGEPVVEGTGWHWPWESSIVSKPKAQAQQDAFQWPWDAAAKSVGDTVGMVQNVLLGVFVLFLLGLGLWVFGKAKGALR